MTRSLLLLALLSLPAACGADGAPTPPSDNSRISVSGMVKVGVSGGS